MLSEILNLVTALMCSVLIFVLSKSFFMENSKVSSPKSVSSHFKVGEVTSGSNAILLNIVISIPAVIFFVANVMSVKFIDNTVSLLVEYASMGIPDKMLRVKVIEWSNTIDSFLNPIVLLILILFLFSAFLRAPAKWFSSSVLSGFGINKYLDDCLEVVSDSVLHNAPVEGVKKDIEAYYKVKLPLPESLSEEDDSRKLSYYLLYIKKRFYPFDPLDVALREITNKLGYQNIIPSSIGGGSSGISNVDGNSIMHIYAALVFYLVLQAMHVLSIPMLGEYIIGDGESLVRVLKAPFSWPEDDKVVPLLLEVSQRTLTLILPLALGLQFYNNRRVNYPSEGKFISFAVVSSLIIVISVVMNSFFMLLYLANQWSHEFTGSFTFGEAKIYVYILMFSLASVIALGSCVYIGDFVSKGLWLAVFVSVIVGVAMMFAQYLFELSSVSFHGGKWSGYYWYQFVLGVYLTLSYYVAAVISQGKIPRFSAAEVGVQPR